KRMAGSAVLCGCARRGPAMARTTDPSAFLLAIVLDDARAVAQHHAAAGIFLQRGAEDGARQRDIEGAGQDLFHTGAVFAPQLDRVSKLLVMASARRRRWFVLLWHLGGPCQLQIHDNAE